MSQRRLRKLEVGVTPEQEAFLDQLSQVTRIPKSAIVRELLASALQHVDLEACATGRVAWRPLRRALPVRLVPPDAGDHAEADP